MLRLQFTFHLGLSARFDEPDGSRNLIVAWMNVESGNKAADFAPGIGHKV